MQRMQNFSSSEISIVQLVKSIARSLGRIDEYVLVTGALAWPRPERHSGCRSSTVCWERSINSGTLHGMATISQGNSKREGTFCAQHTRWFAKVKSSDLALWLIVRFLYFISNSQGDLKFLQIWSCYLGVFRQAISCICILQQGTDLLIPAAGSICIISARHRIWYEQAFPKLLNECCKHLVQNLGKV